MELIERLVLALTNPGDWVLDPYMGVGTSAIASLMHKRKSIGAEIMPEYFQIALDRIRLAEKGELKIRPMERPVYDPDEIGVSLPPKTISLGTNLQGQLFETQSDYEAGAADESDL